MKWFNFFQPSSWEVNQLRIPGRNILSARVRVLGAWLDGPLGWLPILVLVMALGLLLVSLAFRASVSGAEGKVALYWLGLLLLVIPAAARLAARSPQRAERLALVMILGMALYGVKVMHSPAAFTYADELVHYANTQNILTTHRLFGENSILPVTPFYPGLPLLTSVLSSLTGLSIFSSGLIVVAAARIIIMLSLFLLYEGLSSSSRVAGLAAVFYTANSNFLYWSAQYSYESIALPLAVFVAFAIFILLPRSSPTKRSIIRHPAFLVALIGVFAITVTHHLTSIALAVLLALGALFSTILPNKENREVRLSLYILTSVAIAAVLLWNLIVATGTRDYILPVLLRAINAGVELLTGGGEESGRVLFESNSSVKTPIWERVLGITSVLLILAAIPFGLWAFWRRLRTNALGWILVVATLSYFPLQGLRFTGPGWETANRASAFLFVGIAFIVSLAFLMFRVKVRSQSANIVVGIAAAILFSGGVISGWPPTLRMARPYNVELAAPGLQQESISPQGVAAAEWALTHLKPGSRIAGDNSSARLMQAYGQKYALAGSEYGIRALFFNETIDRGELEIIQVTGIEYLVFTRPQTRWDQMLGLYYNPAEGLLESEAEFLRSGNRDKFDENPGVDRLLDTGYVVLYDIGGLLDVAKQR
jgi:hypothetical protein